MTRFRDQLRRQMHFIENSCANFDKGDLEEAIRIATCVRVLLHDTKSSTSLLKHLNATDISLFNTCPDFPNDVEDGYQSFIIFNMGVMSLGKTNFGYHPNLEDFKPGSSSTLPVQQWWEQVVWRLSPQCMLTRKRLLLSAANQDGGAHVDANLNLNYEELTRYNCGTMSLTENGNTHNVEVVRLHLISIRTIANEILKSPDLIKLSEQ